MTLLRVIVAISWILINCSMNSLQVQAQDINSTNNSRSSSDSSIKQKTRDPNRKGGGDRGNCEVKKSVSTSLTALVAEKGEAVTISDSPTFLFYVPYSSNSSLNARFLLQDENGSSIIKPPIMLTLSGTPGVVRVPLPKSLKKGKLYRWFFTIICNPIDSAKDMIVDGWLRQGEPSYSLTSQLRKKLSQRERALLYRKEGFWLDALAILADIRYKDPLAEGEWNNLLKSLNLGDIASEKIVKCCTPKR